MSNTNYDTDHTILKQIDGDCIEILSFFKGVKLISNEKIISIKKNKLTIQISNKQKLNLLTTKKYFIIVGKHYYLADATLYNKEENQLVFDNISKTPHNELNRNEVRLRLHGKNATLQSIKKNFPIEDISEKSLSLLSSENSYDKTLSNTTKITLTFLRTTLDVEFLKTVSFNDQNKYIYVIKKKNDPLTKYIYEMQRNILKQYSAKLQKL